MTENRWRCALPLALAALLFLGGCDEEEKPPEVTVNVPKGTVVKVEHSDKDEMIIAGELALFSIAVIWALFGPGSRRRLDPVGSDDR